MKVDLLVLVALCILGVFREVIGDMCGGNCATNDCPSCPCGTTMRYANITNVCAQYGGWSFECCACMVSLESGGDLNAANYNHSSRTYDVGLWQINQNNWPSCNGGSAPCNEVETLQCAIKQFQSGGNTWKGWSTCAECECCIRR